MRDLDGGEIVVKPSLGGIRSRGDDWNKLRLCDLLSGGSSVSDPFQPDLVSLSGSSEHGALAVAVGFGFVRSWLFR